MIIAFTGGMGVGKSTAINYVKKLNKDVKLVKFAQPLYDIQEYVYAAVLPVYKRPNTFVKDRKLLQWLGTDWGRNTISENVWVDIFKASALKAQEDKLLVVCDDCRFDNEAKTLKELGGVIIKLTSDNAAQRIDTVSGISNHASENGVDMKYVDFVVSNNGTIEEFESSLRDVLTCVFEGRSALMASTYKQ